VVERSNELIASEASVRSTGTNISQKHLKISRLKTELALINKISPFQKNGIRHRGFPAVGRKREKSYL